MDEIRKLAESKNFAVRFIDFEGTPVTLIGSGKALDKLIAELGPRAVEVDPERPPVPKRGEAA